jgi:hypothetical protein
MWRRTIMEIINKINMEKEKYQPTEEEMKKAEGMARDVEEEKAEEIIAEEIMLPSQKKASTFREAVLMDLEKLGHHGNLTVEHNGDEVHPPTLTFMVGDIDGMHVRFGFSTLGGPFEGQIDGEDISSEDAEKLFENYSNLASSQIREKKAVKMAENELKEMNGVKGKVARLLN